MQWSSPNGRNRWRPVAALLLAGVSAATVALGGHATPLVIPPSAFLSDGWTPEGYELWSTGHLRGKDIEVHLVAPVSLPQGAHVRSFAAHLYDNYDTDAAPCAGPARDVTLVLRRSHLASGTAESIATIDSAGASATVELIEAPSIDSSRATVDNDAYAYYVDLRLCSTDHHLNAVWIEY